MSDKLIQLSRIGLSLISNSKSFRTEKLFEQRKVKKIMRDTKLIKSSLFILNLYFFGFGVSVEEESKNDEFQSNITGIESI